MAVATAIAAITLTADHIARGWRIGIDAGHFLRSAQVKATEGRHHLEMIRSSMTADDENRIRIEAAIEALQ